MRVPIAIVLPALFLGAATAQPRTLPPGYDAGEAASYSYYLGQRPGQRCQVIHGETAGAAGTYRKLSLRVDRFPTGPTPLAGRRWSAVTLRMAEGPVDYASTQTTFAQNHLSTATTVFSGAVHWPATNAGYEMEPTPWGGAGGLAFPFTGPWVYSGKNGVCADFDFRGGTLDNGQSWTSTVSYYVDGVPRYTAGGSQYRLYGKQSCRATGRSTYNSYHPEIATYATSYPQYGGKFRFLFRYFGLPASAASTGAVLAIAVGGSVAGHPFQGSCNPLHVDMGKLVGLQLFLPSATGRGNAPYPSHQLLDFDPALAGVDVWAQVAYDDGGRGRTQLSMAGRNRMWPLPNANRAVVYGPGTVTGGRSGDRVPVLYLE